MNDQDKKSTLDQFFASLDPKSGEADDLETNTENRALVAEGQRACPICGQKMISQREEGILIDVCVEHGVWLDKGELAAVIRRSKADAVQSAMAEAGESGQNGGFLLGFALGKSL
jgi:hypothetical protein